MKSQKSAVLAVLALMFLRGLDVQAQSVTARPLEPQDLSTVLSFTQERGGLRGGAQEDAFRVRTLTYQSPVVGGAWWTNTALVERLGLTDDQKAKIERAYENHRVKIMSSTEQLEKDEAQLARLLDAESIDRNAVLTQIDRVIQARGEVERANSAMTLEMREYLTRAQWLQLPRVSSVPGYLTTPGTRGGGRTGGPANSSTPTAPPPGARRGGRGTQ